MYDVHCHLLPGIDDGAKTIAESLQMAKLAVGEGIKHAVMTPHLHIGRYENVRSRTEGICDAFRRALYKERIDLEISLAAEVRINIDILSLLDKNEVPFLGEIDGYRIMLLEFPHSHIPHGSEKMIDRLMNNKIRPMLAHPERNGDILRDIKRIGPFIERGCLTQLTANAVAGRLGDQTWQRARQLLELGVVTVLATDAHDLKRRPPELRAGVKAAAAIIGHKAARALVCENAQEIVRSERS